MLRGWGYHGWGFRDVLWLFDEGLSKAVAELGDLGCLSRDQRILGLVDVVVYIDGLGGVLGVLWGSAVSSYRKAAGGGKYICEKGVAVEVP